MKKLFVVRKYVRATSAADAIRQEGNCPVDEVWVDEEWKKANVDRSEKLAAPIGFTTKKKDA